MDQLQKMGIQIGFLISGLFGAILQKMKKQMLNLYFYL
jgi:hypothetical protein